MNIVVQKYGGTSVADSARIKHVAQRVVETKRSGQAVVVVVSAQAGMTDYLLDKAKEIDEQANGRELDMILATGEQMSMSLLAMAIQRMGEKALSLTATQAGIVTNHVYNKARIQTVDTARILKALRQNQIVIIAGFQGMASDYEITTLGRGGSDITAVALGASLKASVVEIYTDVDGVYTADPNIVSNAVKIAQLSYTEMLAWAEAGAKVLHARSVELAEKYHLPVRLRSSFTTSRGTMIAKEGVKLEESMVRGIAHTRKKARIMLTGLENNKNVTTTILKALAQAHITIDHMQHGQTAREEQLVTLTVAEEDYACALKLMHALKNENQVVSVTGTKDIAQVTIVGRGLMADTKIITEILNVLSEKQIAIDTVSCEERKLTFMLKENNLIQAVCCLHDYFNLSNMPQASEEISA